MTFRNVSILALAMAATATSADFSFTLLHHGDRESYLNAAGTGALAQYGGVSRFSTKLTQLRAANPHSAFVSAGDNIIPSIRLNASLVPGAPFYDAIAMNSFGYDAVALGNHDFDLGPSLTRRLIDGVNAPFVSANVNFTAEPALSPVVGTKLVKATTKVINGETVGFIGTSPENLRSISSPGNVTLNPYVPSILAEADNFASMGVNKVILLSHNQALANDLAMVSSLRNVDVIVSAGGEEVLGTVGSTIVAPGDTISNPYPLFRTDSAGKNVALVASGSRYKYIGELDLTFTAAGDLTTAAGQLHVVASKTAQPVVGVDADTTLQASVVDPVNTFEATLATQLIARTEVALDGVRNNVRTRETNLGSLVADAFKIQSAERAEALSLPLDNPLVALTNGGGIRINAVIPAAGSAADNISKKTTFDVLPFFNNLGIVRDIDSARLLVLLENAVSRVEFTDGRFAQISGLKFTYDPTLPVGDRIIDVLLEENGVLYVNDGIANPLAPKLDLATTDFLFNGGDSYNFSGLTFDRVGLTYLQALEDYLTLPASQGGLGGDVLASQYPVGGLGRITVGGNLTGVIPEPASLSLVVLAGLSLARRRRA
jgi:5'-nucleotidase